MKKLVTIALCSAVLSVLAAGCKQGPGERCQVDADCADGMICSDADPQTCGNGTEGDLDAEAPADAVDAPAPVDASPPPDAPPDA